ncbi:hypothetical protein VV01_00380 [Luteipulveratus halotolerans]|nr:hypothetical protein VV01_00380 [Luteipulveratus halotolerans]
MLAGMAARSAASRQASVRVGERFAFTVARVPGDRPAEEAEDRTLHLVVGADDSGAMTFVIMLPDED